MIRGVLVVFGCVYIVSFVNALTISEIMYDPEGTDTGREWIEVQNTTDSGIDLTSWKFFEANTNHSITLEGNSGIIAPGAFAVVTDNPEKFKSDYPSYTGLLYDSAFSLSNSGELISFKNASGVVIDSITYNTGIAGGSNTTLSLLEGVWVRGAPTPGAVNLRSSATSTPAGETASTTEEVTISPVVTMSSSPDVNLIVETERTVIAGADSDFQVKAITSSGKSIDGLTYTWTFGDGGTKVGKSVAYHYAYPGYYIAVVQAENSSLIGREKIRVRVIPPQFTLAEVGVGPAGAYADIENKSNEEIDISRWILTFNGQGFIIPINTILLPNTKTRMSGAALGFSTSTFTSLSRVRLLYPDNSEVIRYDAPTSTVATTTVSTSSPVVGALSSQKVVARSLPAKAIPVPKAPSAAPVATSSSPRVQAPQATRDTRLFSWFKELFR